MNSTDADPKGLIRESYAIDGITLGECRSIFIDWALSLAPGVTLPTAIEALLAHYANSRPDHPMSITLREGLTPAGPPRRRGGRAGRLGPA
ncbi:MAG: hypothetical protein ACRC6I_13245 [Paracoccaceae bacterium]